MSKRAVAIVLAGAVLVAVVLGIWDRMIAEGVVDRVGGEIGVRSIVGKGSVFTVTLPAAAAAS